MSTEELEQINQEVEDAIEEELPLPEVEEVEEEEPLEAVEPSDEETVARAAGWRPKEEFDGDPNQWVDAGEFNRRAPLFEKINNQNKELQSSHNSHSSRLLDQMNAYLLSIITVSAKFCCISLVLL